MQDTVPKTIIFLGRPGSGKGTQAKLLAEKLKWKMYSSGGHFKGLIDKAGPLSEDIRRDYDNGHLSPDWLAAYFFEEAILDLERETGFVCEGFPRSLPQAKLADDIFAWLERPYVVIHLKVSEEEALRRQLSRAKVEDRPDSNTVAKVETRFAAYRKTTEPIVEYYRDNKTLIEVNGEQSPEAIAADIDSVLGIA